MSKLLVIVGSTRPDRAADRVLPWLTEKTAGHPAFDTELIPGSFRLRAAMTALS